MRRLAILFSVGWGLLSAALFEIFRETFWSAFTDWIIKELGFREGAEMIADAAAVALPLAGAAAIVGAVYFVGWRHGKGANGHLLPALAATQELPALPPRDIATSTDHQIEWLAPERALRSFLDDGLMTEYAHAEALWWHAFQGKDGKSPASNEITLAAGKRVLAAENLCHRNLYDLLRNGRLIARGTIAPLTPASVEMTVPVGWWSFLQINVGEAEATGNGTKIVGIMIGKPNR